MTEAIRKKLQTSLDDCLRQSIMIKLYDPFGEKDILDLEITITTKKFIDSCVKIYDLTYKFIWVRGEKNIKKNKAYPFQLTDMDNGVIVNKNKITEAMIKLLIMSNEEYKEKRVSGVRPIDCYRVEILECLYRLNGLHLNSNTIKEYIKHGFVDFDKILDNKKHITIIHQIKTNNLQNVLLLKMTICKKSSSEDIKSEWYELEYWWKKVQGNENIKDNKAYPFSKDTDDGVIIQKNEMTREMLKLALGQNIILSDYTATLKVINKAYGTKVRIPNSSPQEVELKHKSIIDNDLDVYRIEILKCLHILWD